jgi:hypothetical protein
MQFHSPVTSDIHWEGIVRQKRNHLHVLYDGDHFQNPEPNSRIACCAKIAYKKNRTQKTITFPIAVMTYAKTFLNNEYNSHRNQKMIPGHQ